jgi:hypothetical protein
MNENSRQPDKDIDSKLTKDIESYRRLARVNYRIAYFLSATAVIASIVAGLSVAGEWFSREILALLSALPGAVLVISGRFRFEERSAWHWRKTYALKSLLYQHQFENKSDAEISAQWRKVNDNFETDWPGFGEGLNGG